MTLKKMFVIDGKKPLSHLPLYWLALLGCVVPSTVLFAMILVSANLVYSPTYEGINHFINVFKVPLSLLGLSIPMSALIASLHKSAQTELQIKLSHRHSLFSNYNAHFTMFNLYIDESRWAQHIERRVIAHRNFFTGIHN
ncbi:hypothetical protein, partial [Vibrio breoganii]|uniref:hypothetical protein n=1 Tax=Vibrio breoganii TaxID=553239 RepID=UPI003BB6F36E